MVPNAQPRADRLRPATSSRQNDRMAQQPTHPAHLRSRRTNVFNASRLDDHGSKTCTTSVPAIKSAERFFDDRWFSNPRSLLASSGSCGSAFQSDFLGAELLSVQSCIGAVIGPQSRTFQKCAIDESSQRFGQSIHIICKSLKPTCQAASISSVSDKPFEKEVTRIANRTKPPCQPKSHRGSPSIRHSTARYFQLMILQQGSRFAG